jgi:nucleotide-binding universal stress UspA family protein
MTIIVGYVPRPEGRAALEAAIEQARTFGSRLHVVNFARGDKHVDSSFASPEDIAELRRLLDDSGVDYDVAQVVTGEDAWEDVVHAADEHQARLIVIGMRRRSATGKLLFGSNSQRILMESHCPVLAVKASDSAH